MLHHPDDIDILTTEVVTIINMSECEMVKMAVLGGTRIVGAVYVLAHLSMLSNF